MQGVQEQIRRVMSVRLTERRYERLLSLQRAHSKDEIRTVSCNEIICSMIRDYTAPGAPKLEVPPPGKRGEHAQSKVLSVRMPLKLYERLLRLQRVHSKEQTRTVSYNELIRAMIRDKTNGTKEELVTLRKKAK